MKKAIIFLLSFYSCAGFAESQQARSDYSTEESQAKVNKILHTTSLYRKGLSYSERVAEISSRFTRNALPGVYTDWIIFDAREAGH
ncbi:Uncharacterised protein [Klebsiella pneumoniae]|nr:Uncharacterised protein [Klebsiella pneumoniae]STS67046.1 Uncharacterised protein [Klebsiella pneumoniae]STS71059.1 Uncharacterised protein [Klebsiella pneumoniae]